MRTAAAVLTLVICVEKFSEAVSVPSSPAAVLSAWN
jgi:hypothetical protein